ncbi:Tetratricopeptide repeat (TPR)-containing protein isoform 3 [Theobroma cacao]|uniref:Tetratricopeptide repeat (TPR)-containing protein isoform 3 n=1 Tax=Theobroma cacao TaxID=3641 RepID=A0A061DJZ2_THECC|nr:Tetratricopeptide repeat (TPR)-containing protein isoform 3 [Theobroma cacao]
MAEDDSQSQELATVRELCANGVCMRTTDVEAKLDEGNIHEAESSLREGLSLNFEEARALLGRLEYQRGNVEGALRVFDGIDLQAAIQRLQPSTAVSQHAASLVLEGVYLKAKSLQKLGRFTEAAQDCTNVLDAVGRIFPQGIPGVQVENRLQETVSQAVELLPELWKQAGNYQEAMSAYRRGLLHLWNLDNDCCARIQKAFAVFLLYSGLEAGPPSLGAQVDGAYVPKNNLEEAILLLMVLVQKIHQGIIQWDPSVMDHLTYALSLCSQTPVLSKQLEELKPGVVQRIDRWNTLALCCSAAGQNKYALNLLRKSLHKHERPDDLTALLLAAKICSEDSHLAADGVGYAQRAINNAQGVDGHLKGVGFRMLGLCLRQLAKIAFKDTERSHLQSEALLFLDAAIFFEQDNADIIFELGVQHAEQRNLNAALHYAKKYIDVTGGSVLKGWRLLALVLSAQHRFSEAAVVTDAALDETAKWEQGPLLRLKAKLEISQSRPMDAIETYRYLLALVQAQRKSFGPMRIDSQVGDDKVNEFEVWHGLANLYSSLSHWKDVEICLRKAREMKQYSAKLLQTEGVMCQERGEIQEAMSAYINAILLEPSYAPCKVLISAMLSKMGSNSVPVARTLLSDALRIEPTNHKAWYYLGMIQKDDGRLTEAIESLQAAYILEESDPVESFRSLL